MGGGVTEKGNNTSRGILYPVGVRIRIVEHLCKASCPTANDPRTNQVGKYDP